MTNKDLANVIFPNITKTIEDYEKEYPKRNLSDGAMVTRFAPSPTGFVHMGSLLASFIERKAAKDTNGVFYIRIEDTDAKREVENGIDGIIKDLRIKLKENDSVISVSIEDYDTVFLTTNTGYGLSFKTEEIPLVGVKASGVKAMKLKDDYLVSMNVFSYQNFEYITIITKNGTGKRVRLQEFDISSRTRRGIQVLRAVKSNPYIVL